MREWTSRSYRPSSRVIALALIAKSVLIVPKGMNVVVGKLGRAERTVGPGFHIVVPFISTVVARLPAGEQEPTCQLRRPVA
jgi:regulator of protease activity HflC (stomatin/prohibitin superfamily)